MTAYDRQTHALIKNVDRASRASNSAEVQKNANGSVDLYFGPKAPAGKESELGSDRSGPQVRTDVPTVRADKALFEKAWKLPDVEQVSIRDDRNATMKKIALACVLVLTVSVQAASGQSSSDNAVPVTVDNFIRAEF